MTKYLIDPIYTADFASCSCAFKFKQIVQHLGDQNPEAYFYWVVPEKDGGGFAWSEEWFPHPERVEIVQVPQFRDRIREYSNFEPARMQTYSPFGTRWDWDYCITSRIPQIAMHQMMSHRWGAPYPEQHRFIGFDDFPLFSFKDAIPNTNTELTELLGYLQTERTFLPSFWERAEILKRARHYLSPSQVMSLMEKLQDALPHKAEKVKPKSHDNILAVAQGKTKFTVGYTQRIERERRRTDEVFEVWNKFYAMNGDDVRFVTSSATSRAPVPVPEFVERMKLPREEFHALLENEINVTLVFSTDEGYPLSVVEPLIHGVPGIIYKATYAVNVLGPDYPFYFTTTAQAYGFLQAFKEDYESMYAMFHNWLTSTFQKTLDARGETYLPESIEKTVDGLDVKTSERYATEALSNNDVLAQLKEAYPKIKREDGTWTMREFFYHLHDEGYFTILAKTDVYWDSHDAKGQLSRVFQRQLYRQLLRVHYGCTDASVAVGHFTEPHFQD